MSEDQTTPESDHALADLSHRARWVALGLGSLAALFVGVWAEHAFGWLPAAFDAVAHQFYEVPLVAAVRRPGQVELVRHHLALFLLLFGITTLIASRLSRHGRWAVLIFFLGYSLRATAWIVGGNLPLVPGDSCHYLEVATSVYRGEGAVKHYVESFFRDYPAIRAGQGVLDDWATPLYAYVLAGTYRLIGVVPGREVDHSVTVAKMVSFLASVLGLPAIYGFGRRRYDRATGLGAMALLAVLPVHVIYAGFALRESLVALTSILGVWALTEVWSVRSNSAAWMWAIVAGALGGLAILSRNTALVILAGAGLFGLIRHGRRRLGPLLLWGTVLVVVIAPWAWVTYREYGQPFYSYTNYFQYNFSWAVHHYQKGNTRPEEFYTAANAPEIVRVKIKSLGIIVATSTMIVGLPTVFAAWRRLHRGNETDRLVWGVLGLFMLATLANIADVTQVAQLGRYYLPVFALMTPCAVAGFREWLSGFPGARSLRTVLALSLFALLWADPTWAYDAGWYLKDYQLHWPALREVGDWIKDSPDAVPPEARIMTWFPWEMRVASDRITVLMPRNYRPDRIDDVIRQYGVTHVLWGSFEPPPHVDPEVWGPYLERVRRSLGLTDERQLYTSPPGMLYPVRLYRVR